MRMQRPPRHRSGPSWALSLWVACAGCLLAAHAHADETDRWSASYPQIAADVAAGRPLVTIIIVPLCHNEQIACGRGGLGSPGNLHTNLYWGALYGARRYFERPESGFERIDLATQADPADPWLARAAYRRWVPGAPWGLQAGRQVEQITVLYAVHGASINEAVDRFWAMATRGGKACFRDGGRHRKERIHVAGYAGHNRLMDGKRLPPAPPESGRAIPSFVLACLSERFFAAALRRAGSLPLVTTQAYIAPEGYVLTAAARALGRNASLGELRDEVVRAYAKAHGLSSGAASRLFAAAPSTIARRR